MEKFTNTNNKVDYDSIENLFLLTQGFGINENSVNMNAKINEDQISKREIVSFLDQIFALEKIYGTGNKDRDRTKYLNVINKYILLNKKKDSFHANDFGRFYEKNR